ncbi:hypothetical protein VTH06DRAFT_5708, partial [Thermothelomyces fergusii]
GYSGLF